VTCDVISRDRRTGKNELTGFPPVIDEAADMIPEYRFHLPFIDQPGNIPSQNQHGINRHRLTGILIDIEKDLAGGSLSGRGSLPGRLGPLDDDSTRR